MHIAQSIWWHIYSSIYWRRSEHFVGTSVCLSVFWRCPGRAFCWHISPVLKFLCTSLKRLSLVQFLACFTVFLLLTYFSMLIASVISWYRLTFQNREDFFSAGMSGHWWWWWICGSVSSKPLTTVKSHTIMKRSYIILHFQSSFSTEDYGRCLRILPVDM